MSREDELLRAWLEKKNWLAEAVNSNTYFRTAVPLQGYRFDFFDVLKKYLVNQYGQWTEYYAPDRTSLRAYLYGRINQISRNSQVLTTSKHIRQ